MSEAQGPRRKGRAEPGQSSPLSHEAEGALVSAGDLRAVWRLGIPKRAQPGQFHSPASVSLSVQWGCCCCHPCRWRVGRFSPIYEWTCHPWRVVYKHKGLLSLGATSCPSYQALGPFPAPVSPLSPTGCTFQLHARHSHCSSQA